MFESNLYKKISSQVPWFDSKFFPEHFPETFSVSGRRCRRRDSRRRRWPPPTRAPGAGSTSRSRRTRFRPTGSALGTGPCRRSTGSCSRRIRRLWQRRRLEWVTLKLFICRNMIFCSTVVVHTSCNQRVVGSNPAECWTISMLPSLSIKCPRTRSL